jgi:hypothetical protein
VANHILSKSLYWCGARFPLDFEKNIQVTLLDIDSHERNEGESKFGFFKLLNTASNIILSLMTLPRLIIWSLISLTLSAIVLPTLPYLSVLLIGGTLLVILRYKLLAGARYLNKIRVSESANINLPDRTYFAEIPRYNGNSQIKEVR